MERRLFITARGGAQVDSIRLFRTEDPKVFSLYVNGVVTGIDVHVADMKVAGSSDYFPWGGNELDLKIQAKEFALPEITSGGND